MRKDDQVRLQHMLEAAREAMSFASGRTRAHLDSNRMLVLSLVKDIEIVGVEIRERNPVVHSGGGPPPSLEHVPCCLGS